MRRRIKRASMVPLAAVLCLLATAAAAASSPSVQTGSVSRVSDSSADLHGTVNPNGSDTTYYFQWGLSSSYGATGRMLSAGAGSKALAVQETAANLIAGTTYHYRLVASNRYGTAVGADRTFKTAGSPPPGAATGPATEISTTGATLTGVVNPHGARTTWTFQYGLASSYGMQTFGGTAGPGGSSVEVASKLQGLDPDTLYHYRVVASHSGAATTYGADATFMTYPSRRPVPAVNAATKPRRARHRPFTFTTSGDVAKPSSTPNAYACTGDVAIRFMHGRRQVAFTLVSLQPGCTFTAQTVFKHLPRHRKHRRAVTLAVLIRFRGNAYLAPRRAPTEHVVLG